MLRNVRCCHDRRITTRGDARDHHVPAEDTLDLAVVPADQQHSQPLSTHPVACLPQGLLPTHPRHARGRGLQRTTHHDSLPHQRARSTPNHARLTAAFPCMVRAFPAGAQVPAGSPLPAACPATPPGGVCVAFPVRRHRSGVSFPR